MTAERAPRALEDLPEHVSVLVAGGGPSGLVAALDLTRRGIDCLVVEPREQVDPFRPRAKTTNARTMTLLRALGVADRLRAASPLTADYSEDVVFATGVAGHELRRFRHAFQLYRDGFAHAPEIGQRVPQPVVEEVLQRRIRADYVVAADGGASAVRKSLGIPLQGSSAPRPNVNVFRSRELADRVTLGDAVQYWIVGPVSGMLGRLDLDERWWAIVQGVDPEQGADPADLVRALAGVDVDVEVLGSDPWTARMLLAESYGRGRVFLVGDAAHLNPPWGGHGFNTCVVDALNLTWKLAEVLQGRAGSALLDSYAAERRPAAARMIETAAANGTALAYSFVVPGLADDGPVGDAARAEVGERLAVKDAEFHAEGIVFGYTSADSPIVVPDGTRPPPDDPVVHHPSACPGGILPHLWLSDGRSVYDALGPRFTLLAARDLPDGAPSGDLGDCAVVELPEADRDAALGAWERPFVLVRPDGHVAWRGEHPDQVADALRRSLWR
ncbi:FAD-dependent monooxygenase [Agilicoccus flavus]|uniref:FAD-dependent monooxygenase n=1 Tax=Agilicoccus flavus TaxID=2775968 RepID=UPI001CF682EA|nr:FAD-dependent monooxygenase [Agilicoccus flavus]